MAVVSSRANKKKQTQQRKEKKLNSPSKKEMKSSQQKKPIPSPAGKRNSCPGVRVVGGRIYDSHNGKTCHQCRQKTMDFTAACVNQKKDKPCTIRFCHKCLLNRYGEKAEEVAKEGNWNCPKCRGICNCSFCMKKRGYQPTGQLFQTAKARGFSSVSEMLQVKGPENVVCEKVVKDTASEKDTAIVSPRKRGKENLFDGKIDSNLQTDVQKKSNKVGGEGFKKMRNCSATDDVLVNVTTPCHGSQSGKVKDVSSKDKHSSLKEPILHADKKKPKKPKLHGLQNKHEADVGKINVVKEDGPGKPEISYKEARRKHYGDCQNENDCKMNFLKGNCHGTSGNEQGKLDNYCDPDIPLPQGIEVTTVAGIDVPPEDVGNALQFLEFCAVFGKVLEVKKGQAESVLKDIIQGRCVRRGKYSLTVQFLIHLLSFIQKEQGERSSTLSPTYGKNSWIHALKECIFESQNVAKSMDLDLLHEGPEVYESLSSSEKLRLLNFLCDEILGTVKIRDWIEEQNAKFAEKAKEAREKVLAAKDKERQLKRKMQADIAEAIIAKNGAPLSISDHDAIISKIKSEVAQAQAVILESQGLLSKNSQRCDAVRTEPILLDIDGHAYWRLKCYSDKSNMLLQDVGSGNALALDERWSAFDVDQNETIEKKIISRRWKRLTAQRLPVITTPR